jgi:hypothetical protein
MNDHSRPRYVVLQPLTVHGGRVLWIRVGHAVTNMDGTIDAVFEEVISRERFRLSPLASTDDENTAPGGKPPAPVNYS